MVDGLLAELKNDLYAYSDFRGIESQEGKENEKGKWGGGR